VLSTLVNDFNLIFCKALTHQLDDSSHPHQYSPILEYNRSKTIFDQFKFLENQWRLVLYLFHYSRLYRLYELIESIRFGSKYDITNIPSRLIDQKQQKHRKSENSSNSLRLKQP
jgi:hypothetical protein